MNKCYIKFLSGDIESIIVFEGYRVSQLKNEMIEEFIPEARKDLIMVFNEDYEPMIDRDFVNMGEIYSIFIKDKPLYITLKFKKSCTGGIFSLHDENNTLISVCGYGSDREMEEKMKDTYIDILYVEKLYKNAYKRIRCDLSYEDEDEETDEDALNVFITIFIKKFCKGINNIVFT